MPNYENDTYEISSHFHEYLIDKYIPLENKTLNLYNKCKIHSFNDDANATESQHLNNSNTINETLACTSWVFSKKYYDKTIVNDV